MTDAHERLAELEERFRLVEFVDTRLEISLREREPLEPTLRSLFPHLLASFQADAIVVQTIDEALEERRFSAGGSVDAYEGRIARAHARRVAVADADLVVHPLDVAGEDFGCLAVVSESGFPSRARTASLLASLAETLDNHLASIALARAKYVVAKRLSDALREPVLDVGLDRAIEVMREEVAFDAMVLAFHHEDDTRGASLRYRILRSDGSTLDSRTPGDAESGAALAQEALAWLAGGSRVLLDRLGIERFREEVLIHGVEQKRIVGRLVVTNPRGEFHTHDRELLDRFADALRQRIVDYNREWKVLSQSFPAGVVHRLLGHEQYRDAYMRPTVRDVAIVYSDIAGFSRISEQVLREPARIGALIDAWGARVVDVVWEEGGVFDKMVGDCVIAFFGPPFHEMTAEEACARAIRAARRIAEVTRALASDPAFPELATLSPPIDVATGINYAPLCVGIFGPDEDYTGFSSGMNNTARLQGVATRGQILCMDTVVTHAEGTFAFGEAREARVKNVAEPLRYRELVG